MLSPISEAGSLVSKRRTVPHVCPIHPNEQRPIL